jgi:hypothetical protein
VFYLGSDPRLYNEDPWQPELELRESLEMGIEDNLQELTRKELGCAKKTSSVL